MKPLTKLKLSAWLNKDFPSNAKGWDNATDEIRDISRFSRQILDVVDDKNVEPLDFSSLTTPSDWNTKAKKYIDANYKQMSKMAQQVFLYKVQLNFFHEN